MVGMCAGSINGILLSPLAVIKYHGWGTDANASFFSAATDILSKGGLRVLFKGAGVAILRDSTFGIVYEVARGRLRQYSATLRPPDVPQTFAANVLAGMCACVVASPLNYVRNIIYATPPESSPPSLARSLRMLAAEARASEAPWRLIESRLFLGWGTLRVALGMGIGQLIYEQAKQWLTEY